MFSRFFSGALIKSILGFVKEQLPFLLPVLFQRWGLAKLEHFQCLKRSLPALSSGKCLCWEYFVLCSAELLHIPVPGHYKAFPSAFPLSLNIKKRLSELFFQAAPVQW